MRLSSKIILLLGAAAFGALCGGCEKEETERAEVVEATRIKEITYDSAVCVGYVKGTCSEKGVWYAPAEATEAFVQVRAPKGSGEQFEVALSGLEKGGTYVVKVYALCDGEVFFSPEKRFTTLREGEPLMRFTAPRKTTNTTVELEGYVVSNGGQTILERGFCYGTDAETTAETGVTLPVKGDIGRILAEAGGLEDGATYYGRVYVRNALGIFYSEAEAFATIPYNKPVPTVVGIEGLGTETMTVRAKVEADNELEITGRGIRYSLTEDFDDGTDVADTKTGLGAYSVTVSGLDPEQLYNVWAYAENRKGRAYSEMLTAKAGVRVDAAAALSRSATGSFSIVNLGAFESPVTEAGLCWSTSPAPSVNDAHAKAQTDGGLGIGSFGGVEMWGLKPATTYYVRAYAINEYGRSYSRDFTVTTRQDLYDAQIRPGTAGGKLPYFNAWQIILNDAYKASSANVPEETLSPAFREIYAGLEKAAADMNRFMNGVIYLITPTTDGGLLMRFKLYYRTKKADGTANSTLTHTGWSPMQFHRNEDGTFRIDRYKLMTNSYYAQNTAENKAAIEKMYSYFTEHDFYFEWCSPDYEFSTGGTTEDKTSGPVRMIPVDAPGDYWTFTSRNYSSAAEVNPIANPF